ncbi:hypothetical protein O7621_27205 [Solwaraspora sp. WMMD937]|uniref:hypothetical protein n=1 Tax=Solwaraspora sp. WMMD937 TaxID=3016090 RepID=UPI00249BD6D8|nr:hypothetical protein [Solwaraspora sp. WMMD937]WFE21473.1 hypothetical protein O7621_27205 [Solwaraspora sp. WMMD937]
MLRHVRGGDPVSQRAGDAQARQSGIDRERTPIRKITSIVVPRCNGTAPIVDVQRSIFWLPGEQGIELIDRGAERFRESRPSERVRLSLTLIPPGHGGPIDLQTRGQPFLAEAGRPAPPDETVPPSGQLDALPSRPVSIHGAHK